MERFFTQHNVLKDRDPDELHGRANSDSEASDDEEEISERVHSVHDPTGPWRQTPVDNGSNNRHWGEPGTRPLAGARRRDFQSQHTGPKGVINDYKAHKHHVRDERRRKEQERSQVLSRIANGATTLQSAGSNRANQMEDGCDCDGGSDCECEDLVDAAFLQQYQQQRLQQMQQAAKNRKTYGSLEFVTPMQFVQLTDKDADPQCTLFVHLYHPENYACGLLNTHLATIAQVLPHIKFAAMVATDADATFASADLPVLLVYHGSRHDDTVVNLAEELDGEFTLPRIQRFIHKRLDRM
uniref:Phosducin domain-containing protein n=1 Tax=Globisporangium ultimum (strain ATCC 200006 / CBS 805.95 / DAOM BR144) TaxID=431595 RepID=K3X5Q5_GLOUD